MSGCQQQLQRDGEGKHRVDIVKFRTEYRQVICLQTPVIDWVL